MREEGRVEIAAEASFLTEADPLREVLRFQLVAVRPLAVLEDRVACVQVHLRPSGDQGKHLVEVGHQFFRRPRSAGIVAGGLDAAGEGLARIGIEASHVVSLPAMQRDRDVFQGLNGFFGVHAVRRIFLFRFRVTHLSSSVWIFRFPSAVASMGRAMTFFSVASSVRRFRKAFIAPPPTM